MTENRQDIWTSSAVTANLPPATVETIVAAQLHITDVVRQDGALHTVTSLRVQGAPPEVCVEFAGIPGRRHFLASAPVSVLRHHR